MNSQTSKLYKISIDVKQNDPVDIRCGGPHYLGFDFFVNEGTFKGKTIKGITKSVKTWLHKEKLEFKSVSIREILPYQIWNKEMIKECFKNTQL